MNRLLLLIPKNFILPGVCLLALIIWLALCKSHYDSYWLGTIYRVQTVDFNILHHALPSTLSQLVMSGASKEIQEVLDSTYGIFGIVVTDAEGKEILFRTNTSYKKETWQPLLSVDYLNKQSEPFDLLTDPPPLSTQYKHASPRMGKAKATSAPEGRVIGRVYYVRGVPPGFAEDLAGAVLSNWLEMNGSKRGYILLTLNILGYSIAISSLVMWRRRMIEIRERELKAKELELSIRRKALDHLNADLAAQRKKKEWLEQEAEQAYQRALRLKESLVRLKEAFFLAGGGDPSALPKQVNVRPPLHKTSELISDVESLIPELTHNAKVLKSQADVWQTYCNQLELRQSELQRLLVEKATSFKVTAEAAKPSTEALKPASEVVMSGEHAVAGKTQQRPGSVANL